MATKKGTIWAQSVWWNSTSSTKTRHVVFAKGRNISAYSSLSSYIFVPPFGTGQPWFCLGSTGISWYRNFGIGNPGPNVEFPTPLPYIQAEHVTELKFRLSAGTHSEGSASVVAVHVINYFPPED
jgi:hypothetical protein